MGVGIAEIDQQEFSREIAGGDGCPVGVDQRKRVIDGKPRFLAVSSGETSPKYQQKCGEWSG